MCMYMYVSDTREVADLAIRLHALVATDDKAYDFQLTHRGEIPSAASKLMETPVSSDLPQRHSFHMYSLQLPW